MKKNVGKLDSLIRILAAVVILILVFAKAITGTLAVVLIVVAGLLAITGIIRFCPLYLLFGADTNQKK